MAHAVRTPVTGVPCRPRIFPRGLPKSVPIDFGEALFPSSSRASLDSKRSHARFSYRCAVPPLSHERPLRGSFVGALAGFGQRRNKTPPYATYGGVLPCEMEFEKVVQHPEPRNQNTFRRRVPAVGGEGLHRMKKRTCKSVVTFLQLDCNPFVTACQGVFRNFCYSFLTFLLPFHFSSCSLGGHSTFFHASIFFAAL